ncbi:hypothetical protein SDRG_02890 [Saprolegnia diclina VS20]|uniref:WW domain-containing protein n=1 Tax=Saprolegnia diclina (strain VS20) TaxID=1156394 RepID=T0SBU2_SAPDV|nr:hypothetical protein SDRG_02890 [Saprolegnia diclina VS20]EQC40242.1 hypothetical protein SDRG_02890 [Saprolegnia diclina VS20]|eukprot:XP_008606716.1 hypothetical protein SDRG_02890 [Saprolegnia diclina VS20]
MEPTSLDAPTTDAAMPPPSASDDNAPNEASEEVVENIPVVAPPRTPLEQLVDVMVAAERSWTAKLDEYARRITTLRTNAVSIKQSHHASTLAFQKQLHEAQLKNKSLLAKWAKEKEVRSAEKEWIADAWPSHVVLPPTVLRPFMKDLPATPAEVNARAAAAHMQLALQTEANEIVSRMAQAKQWSLVDGSYFYNAITGESVWEKPAIMAYEPPLGWDKKKMAWREGVVLTLLTDVTPRYTTQLIEPGTSGDDIVEADKAATEQAPVNDDDNDSDAEAEALDPLDVRRQFEVKRDDIARREALLRGDQLALETLSQQLQKVVGHRLRTEAKAIDDEAQAYIAAERKKIAKKQRELAAAKAEADAKLAKEKELKTGRKSPAKSPVGKAVEFEAPPEPEVIAPVDPDRPRLCAPQSAVPVVTFHKVADAAYQHMLTLQSDIKAFVLREDALWEKHDAFRERLEALVVDTTERIDNLEARKAELEESLAIGGDELAALQQPLPQPSLAPEDEDGRSRFDVYDEAMAKWDATAATRAQEAQELEHKLREWTHELKHQPTPSIRDTLGFYEAVVAAEVERGAGLWSKKTEYLVWRTKSLVDRTAREERLHMLQTDLADLQTRLDAAKRVPLQAMNVLERAKLEALSDAQCSYYCAKIQAAIGEIEREEKGLVDLMAYELHALHFHTMRLEEEALLQSDAESLWDDAQAERKVLDAADLEQAMLAKAGLPPSPAMSSARLVLLRQMIALNYKREARWRALARLERTDDTIWLEADEWLLTQQAQRYEARLRDLQSAHAVAIFGLEETIEKLQAELAMAVLHQRQVEHEKATVLAMLQDVDRVVDKTTVETLRLLKLEIQRLEAEIVAIKAAYEAQIEDLVAEHSTARQALETKLEATLADATLRMQWLKAVKCELSDHKVLNEHLLIGIAALEKRRAAEINDMQARIVNQLSKIHRLEMWNMSLKQCIEASNDLMLKYQRDLEAKVQEHRKDQRHLRREIWHQRVSVQLLLANAQHLVRFFLQGVAHLCGHANDALRDASVIPILVALCKAPSVAADLRTLATASLGKIAWNQPQSQRYVGWRAKTMWHNWVQVLTKEAYVVLEETKCDDFDASMDMGSEAMNVSADPREHEKYQSHLDRLHVLREAKRWPHHPTPPDCCVNETNLLAVGDTDGALPILLGLCGPGHPTPVRESALASIAILALHARNTHLMGRTPGFLQTLLDLSKTAASPTLQMHALHSLGNLAFNNVTNQSLLLRLDALPMLLHCCKTQRDVDVLDVATAALASLSQRHEGVGFALLHSDGILQLLELAQAPYLSDAVEDNKLDCIQGNIATVLVHVMESCANGFRSLCAKAPETYVTLCLQLCGSPFTTVQLAAVMVLGHLAMDDALRAWLGDNDAIELLLAFLPDEIPSISSHRSEHQTESRVGLDDDELPLQVSWALIQLSWHRDNQTRLALHLPKLYVYATQPAGRVRVHVLTIVANVLFYHPENRAAVLADPQQRWIDLFVQLCEDFAVAPQREANAGAVEHAVRALTGLSYDAPFASACDHLRICIAVLAATEIDAPVVALALQWLTNLCVLDSQKSVFAHCDGATETVVRLCGANDRHVRDKAQTVLDLVGDARPRWRQ